VSDERPQRSPVSVIIGGEEYRIRAEATPEYTRECAAFLDRMLAEVQQGPLVEGHRATILAALSITDQLFQARAELELLRSEIDRLAAKLAGEIEALLGSQDLASGA